MRSFQRFHLRNRKISSVPVPPFFSWVAVIGFVILATLLSVSPFAISPTFEERMDDSITTCYQETRNPFDCRLDIVQTRFVYYFHAIVRELFFWVDKAVVDRTVTILLVLATVFILYRFLRKDYGLRPAALFVLLAATNATVLASGRLVLSHSNAIFAFCTVASILMAIRYSESRLKRHFIGSAVFFGLSVAASLNGVPTAGFFVFFSQCNNGKQWPIRELAVFFLLSLGTFFIGSVIHAIPANLLQLIVLGGGAAVMPAFRVLGSLIPEIPPYYSALLFVIKVSPWWALVFMSVPALAAIRRLGLAKKEALVFIWFFVVFYFLAKTVVFGYDAPHHQVHIQLLVLALVAVALHYWLAAAPNNAIKAAIIVFCAGGFLLQSYYLWTFKHNYLHYGAQYGQRLVGEFAGPAVAHCQDTSAVHDRVRALLAEGKTVLAERKICWRYIPGITMTERDAGEAEVPDEEFYVSLEGVSATVLNLTPYDRAAIITIADRCRVDYVKRYPYGFPAMTIYACPAGLSASQALPIRLGLKATD